MLIFFPEINKYRTMHILCSFLPLVTEDHMPLDLGQLSKFIIKKLGAALHSGAMVYSAAFEKKIRHLLNIYNIWGVKDQPLEPMPGVSSQFQWRRYKLRDFSTSGSCHCGEAVRTLRKYTEKERADDVTLTWDLKWAYEVEFFKYVLFFAVDISLYTRPFICFVE